VALREGAHLVQRGADAELQLGTRRIRSHVHCDSDSDAAPSTRRRAPSTS
jgi:hypothetical protein